MKVQHYVAIYARSKTPPERLRCRTVLAFEASPEVALQRVIKALASGADRVCLWTWDPERRRLVQRL
jgi:hypothetical protein